MQKEEFALVGQAENTDNKCEKSTNIDTNNNAAEACYSIVKEEYLHTFNRSDKLDNKVYIALTFCAFIFIFVMELLNVITKIKYPTDIYQLVLVVIYIIVSVGNVGVFLHTLVRLATLLKPMQVKRIDADYFMENNLQKQDSYTVYTFAAVKYANTINENNIELEKRFKQYNNCITKIVYIVIVAFFLNMIKILIKMN